MEEACTIWDQADVDDVVMDMDAHPRTMSPQWLTMLGLMAMNGQTENSN